MNRVQCGHVKQYVEPVEEFVGSAYSLLRQHYSGRIKQGRKVRKIHENAEAVMWTTLPPFE